VASLENVKIAIHNNYYLWLLAFFFMHSRDLTISVNLQQLNPNIGENIFKNPMDVLEGGIYLIRSDQSLYPPEHPSNTLTTTMNSLATTLSTPYVSHHQGHFCTG